MKRLMLFLLLVISLGTIAAIFLVPWNSVLENRLTAFLSSQGINNVTFVIDKVGFHEATLHDVMIGTDDPLRLQSITLQYNPKELIDGKLQSLSLTGLDVQVLQTQEGWKIAGVDGFTASDKSSGAAPLTFSQLVDIIPFSKISVTKSYLRVNADAVQTVLPFAMTLDKTAQPKIEIAIDATNLTSGASDISLGTIKAEASQDDAGNWNGTWALDSLNMGEAAPLPELSGGGTLAYTDQLVLDGALASADKTYRASFSGLYNPEDTAGNRVTITTASFPFKDGVLSTRNVVIPLDGKKNITVNLTVGKVSVDALLQTLTGSRVTATGTVSGTIPVIVKRDGSYSLGKGALTADGGGVIQMSGEVIPGDNAQVDLVRKILENLNYSVFSASVDTSGGQGIVVRLSLEGSNPEVYDGRAVKLNVNLTGDILDFIQQNAMLFTSPEKLLKQGNQ